LKAETIQELLKLTAEDSVNQANKAVLGFEQKSRGEMLRLRS